MIKTPFSSYLIRFSDCDLFGHLNNARYIDYFLNAREDHLKQAYDMDLTHFYQQGRSWLVGSHEIVYLKPAVYNEQVLIQSSLVNVTTDSLLVELLMMNAQRTHLKCILLTKFIPINVKTGKKENHSSEFLEFAKTIELKSSDDDLNINARIETVVAELRKDKPVLKEN